jgi:hypothetical protein
MPMPGLEGAPAITRRPSGHLFDQLPLEVLSAAGIDPLRTVCVMGDTDLLHDVKYIG